jgi:predicted Zn-dependent protease
VFGSAVTGANCGKRSLVRLGWDGYANHAGVFTVMAANPGSQARAGAKHGDIAGKHVADEFFDTRSSSHRSQLLDEQRADTFALPGVVDQNRDLSLGAVQDLVGGDADGEAIVFGNPSHMIVAG